jgi:hypothetical protein
MKQLTLGIYTITVYPIGARYWFTISWGKTVLKRGHEITAHRATIRGLDKLETLVNI